MTVCLRNLFHFRRLLVTSSSINKAYLSGFKSNLSLDKIYPNSRLDITTIPKPPESKDGKFTGYIPMDKLEINYCRSSGPGGQNVNCVSTKTEVRFHLATADWIPEKTRTRLTELVRNFISKDGYYIVKSERTRSQHLNLADALDKLRDQIRAAEQSLVQPEASPASLEKQRRLRERAARERLKDKRFQSLTKQGRQAPNIDS
nr:EOG090X0JCO [Chydorus sphaericus]